MTRMCVAPLLEPVEAAIVARNAATTHAYTDDTVVFTKDPTRSATVLDRHFGVDRDEGRLAEGRRLVPSTDFYTVYQSLARVEGVDPLWYWAHMHRYFIRTGDSHVQLRIWRDQWVARIGDLYVAHRAMAASPPGTPDHTWATEDFERALRVSDTTRRDEAQGYSVRWSIEPSNATSRQQVGVGQARNRLPRAVERTVPFGMLVQSLVIVWYAVSGYHPEDVTVRREAQPWYDGKTEPSFEDMITKLRKALIVARFSGPCPAQPDPQILRDYELACAAAAA